MGNQRGCGCLPVRPGNSNGLIIPGQQSQYFRTLENGKPVLFQVVVFNVIFRNGRGEYRESFVFVDITGNEFDVVVKVDFYALCNKFLSLESRCTVVSGYAE